MPAGLDEIEKPEGELEEWLVEQAESSVPEVVSIGLLRDYAGGLGRLATCPGWGRIRSV